MTRVALACYVGSAIEYYDFLIYGTAAALVFPAVFFPHLGPAVATLRRWGRSPRRFCPARWARPCSALRGSAGTQEDADRHAADHGLSTVSVGVVPGTATIGVAAPLILTVLRLLQGFAVGGEWAGSALLSAEYAPPDKRGRYGMFTLIGGGTATGAGRSDLSRRGLHHR